MRALTIGAAFFTLTLVGTGCGGGAGGSSFAGEGAATAAEGSNSAAGSGAGANAANGVGSGSGAGGAPSPQQALDDPNLSAISTGPKTSRRIASLTTPSQPLPGGFHDGTWAPTAPYQSLEPTLMNISTSNPGSTPGTSPFPAEDGGNIQGGGAGSGPVGPPAQPVPEPETVVLFSLGLLIVGFVAWKRGLLRRFATASNR